MDQTGSGGDIVVTRGNNYPPPQWQLLQSENPDVVFDITGNVFKLRVKWNGEEIEHDSAALGGLVVEVATAKVTWQISVDETRELPVGRIAKYELERRFDTFEQVVVGGYVVVSGGINPDG